MKIRNEIIRATYEFFNENGFTKIDPPILTASAPEGQVSYSIQNILMKMHFITKWQLYMEAAAMAHGRVFHSAQLFVQKNLKHVAI